MSEAYAVYVPKDVSMCGRHICLYVYKGREFEFVLSVPCKGMCTWTKCVARHSGGRLILEKLFHNSDK